MADLPARATGGDVTVALNRVVGAVKGDDGVMARRGEENCRMEFSGTNKPAFLVRHGQREQSLRPG